ncbi:hypothetical protein J2X69_003470 [Algoriphagus sp. 4150]|nr:hypothetical protein [Algoriphagus sp. 4150]
MFVIILISNVFLFIPFTFKLLLTGGGPFAFGILLLPFQIIAHLFLIPAFLSLNNKYQDNHTYIWINGIGAIMSILWSTIILINIESYRSLF